MKEGNHLKKHLLALMAVILVAGMAQAASYLNYIAQVPAGAPNNNQFVRVWFNSDTAFGETVGVEYLIGSTYTKVLGTYDTSYSGANWRVDIPSQAAGTAVSYQGFVRNEGGSDYSFTGFNWNYTVTSDLRYYYGDDWVAPPLTATTNLGVTVNRNASSPYFGYVYVCEVAVERKVKIYRPTASGYEDTGWRVAPSTPASNVPYTAKVASDDSVWLLDINTRKVESAPHPDTGTPTQTTTPRVAIANGAVTVRGFAVTGNNTTAAVYVAFSTNPQPVQRYDVSGATVVTTPTWTSGTVGYNIFDVAIDASGNVCVATGSSSALIWRYKASDGTSAGNIAAKPSWFTQTPAVQGLDFINDPTYNGGGYFLYGTRAKGTAPYKLGLLRFDGNGTYLDGFGPTFTGATNYTVMDLPTTQTGVVYVSGDANGNAFLRSIDFSNSGILKYPYSYTKYDAPVAGDLVISQAYGGGGNSGSVYKNDFLEVYNKSGKTLNLTGMSLQYASTTGNFVAAETALTNGQATLLYGLLPAGKYALVREAAGAGGTTDLPTPDVVGWLAMGGTGFKVALVTDSNGIGAVTCPTGATIIDFLGASSTANCYETAAAPAPSNTASVIRNCNNVDTNNNSADFAVCNPPLPRNSSMGTPPLTITGQPTSQTVCSSDLPAVFTVTATGVPPISYQWYTGTPGSGTLLSGETGAYFATSTAGSYYVKVSTACESKDSNGVTLTIKSPATVGTPSASPVALSAGMSTTVTVDVTPGTDPVSSVTAVVNRTGAVTANLTNTGGNTWTGPVAIPTGAASGSATITVTAADGTCNNATNAVGVNVNAITAWVADATASPVHSSPVAVNGIVYYGDDLGRLWAYTISATPTAVAGMNPFDTRTKGAGSGAQILGRPLVRIEGGTPFVYVVTSNGYLFKVNATDGTQPWAAPVQLLSSATSVSTTPAVFNTGDSSLPAQDFVFVGAGDGTNAYLYKVRASDGVLADTSISLGTDTKSSPAVGAGSVYIGVTGGADGVLRLNPVDLEILTNLAAGKTASGAPFISATTDIGRPYPVAYVSTDDGTIYAANATTGALETTFGSGGSVALSITPATGLTPLSSNLFVYGNVLYVGANDNKVYAVNSTTGAVSTFFDAGGSQKAIKHGVAVDPGGSGNTGNLVFGSTDGCFYQIPLANPVAYSVFKVTDPAFYTVSTSPTIDLVGGYNLAGDDFSNVNIFPRF